MRVLLIRPKAKRQPSNWVMRVEPLELEMLSAYLEQEGIDHEIYDQLLEGTKVLKRVRDYNPTHIIYTSYVTAVDEINVQAQKIKAKHQSSLILVGGPHAALNAQDFYTSAIDGIIHSGGIETIGKLLSLPKESWGNLKGIAYQSKGHFIKKAIAPSDSYKNLRPNRQHLLNYRRRWHYLGQKEVALLKTAYGCPYHCAFCYCRLMEKGYVTRPIEEVLREIEAIPFHRIWIVDDTFLVDAKRVEAFIEGIKAKAIHKHFIIYARADFVSQEAALLKELKEIGVEEVIVGLEAVDPLTLQAYHKEVEVEANRRCIQVLNEVGIKGTGLFIYPLEATFATVKQMLKFMKETQLYNATFSIFTPLKGTPLYTRYEKKLLTKKSYKYNFLHTVVKPTKTSLVRYTLYFYILNMAAFYLMLCQRMKRGKMPWEFGILMKKSMISYGSKKSH